MPIEKLLIANRGEIAIRIARAAGDLGITSVAAFSSDDHSSLHRQVSDESVGLDGSGVAAYLDIDQLVEAVISSGCDAVHPGYGLSLIHI